MSLQLLSAAFALLSAAMAVAVVALLARYLEGRARIASIMLFVAWLLYAGVLGFRGVVASKTPPGLAFLLIPTLLFVAGFLVRSAGVKEFASKVPIEVLVGLQTFRIFVEIGLFQLFQLHLVPRLMTFEGGNLDILTGLSAPVIAWLYARRKLSDRAVRIWSWLGLALLANAVFRAFLTANGLITAEVPNTAVGLFPFTFLPGLLVPLALCLHVLLLRSLPRKSEHQIS